MVDLALERVGPEQTTRRDELTALRTEIHKTREAATEEAAKLASLRAYHFGKLPVEIAHTMFSMVLAEDHAYVVILASVCKNWRAAILQTPTFWSTLVVADNRPKPKIKIWKERSKNRVKELALLQDFTGNPAVVEELRTLSVDSLQVLRMDDCPVGRLSAHMPRASLSIATAVAQALRGYPLNFPASIRGDICWNENVPEFRCRALSLSGTATSPDWAELSNSLQHLTSCSLSSCLGSADWPHFLWLLHRNPSIEQLDVISFQPTTYELPTDREYPATITLPLLSSLQLTSTVPDHLLPLLALPSLKTLQLASCRQPLASSLRHLTGGTASVLTTLSIQRAAFDPQILIDMLAAATALETLQLVSIGNNGANVVLEALANTPPIRPPADEAVTSMRVYCPALRHLDCSNNHDVKGGPLVRLVKLRLTEAATASAPDESGADAPAVQPVQALQSLNIDGCPAVDPNVLPWLRERVPKLSSVYMSKKAAGWKR